MKNMPNSDDKVDQFQFLKHRKLQEKEYWNKKTDNPKPLDSILTVESGKPGSHANKGWEEFTTKALIHLNSSLTSIVFILWGNKAKDNVRHIDVKKNLIISSPHPSPFSAKNGFFGSKPFSKTNNFLIKQGLSPIDWDLNE